MTPGPDEIIERVRLAGRTFPVLRPADPDRLLDDPGVRERHAAEDYMPYWAHLWPASRLLARWILEQPPPSPGTWALELGCGLGLAGRAALAAGWNVAFTDHEDRALGYVARALDADGVDPARYRLDRMDWRSPTPGSYAQLFAADVLYEARLAPIIRDALGGLLAPGGLACLADPGRAPADGFPALCAEAGWSCEVVPGELPESESESESGSDRPVGGRLFLVRRPP